MSRVNVRKITTGIGLGILVILALAAMVFFDGENFVASVFLSLSLRQRSLYRFQASSTWLHLPTRCSGIAHGMKHTAKLAKLQKAPGTKCG